MTRASRWICWSGMTLSASLLLACDPTDAASGSPDERAPALPKTGRNDAKSAPHGGTPRAKAPIGPHDPSGVNALLDPAHGRPPLEGDTAVRPQRPAESACTSTSQCAYATIPWVETVSDCACPVCASDAKPITRAELAERTERFRRVCGEWGRANACAPRLCDAPAPLACSKGGSCVFEGS